MTFLLDTHCWLWLKADSRRHRDPFDRLLVAQALVEGLTLVSADPHVLAYDVKSIDARP